MQINSLLPMPGRRRVFRFLSLAAIFCCFASASRAIAQEATQSRPQPTPPTAANTDDVEQLRKTVRQLSAEVSRLRAEVDKLEKYRKIDYLREQMLKEEQRVQALQKELVDIGGKEISLQKRLDEIQSELRPDRIEQSLAGVGSMRPDEQRDAIQKQLSNEKRRIQTQLDQFQQNRVRIQNAISTAEESIARLRLRLKDASRVIR